jgi:uncharacterized protein (TIGR02145 family)
LKLQLATSFNTHTNEYTKYCLNQNFQNLQYFQNNNTPYIPSDAEWTALTDFVGENAGTKLKSASLWEPYDGIPAGTNNFGFAALPGGRGNSSGNFFNVGNYVYWWSATENSADNAYYRFMGYDEGVYRNLNSKDINLFSVRCLQD